MKHSLFYTLLLALPFVLFLIMLASLGPIRLLDYQIVWKDLLRSYVLVFYTSGRLILPPYMLFVIYSSWKMHRMPLGALRLYVKHLPARFAGFFALICPVAMLGIFLFTSDISASSNWQEFGFYMVSTTAMLSAIIVFYGYQLVLIGWSVSKLARRMGWLE